MGGGVDLAETDSVVSQLSLGEWFVAQFRCSTGKNQREGNSLCKPAVRSSRGASPARSGEGEGGPSGRETSGGERRLEEGQSAERFLEDPLVASLWTEKDSCTWAE